MKVINIVQRKIMIYGNNELVELVKKAKTKRDLVRVAMRYVLEKHDFTCALCGNEAVDAHHVFGRGAFYFCNVETIIPLCRDCHILAEKNSIEVEDKIKDWLGESTYNYYKKYEHVAFPFNFKNEKELLIKAIKRGQ